MYDVKLHTAFCPIASSPSSSSHRARQPVRTVDDGRRRQTTLRRNADYAAPSLSPYRHARGRSLDDVFSKGITKNVHIIVSPDGELTFRGRPHQAILMNAAARRRRRRPSALGRRKCYAVTWVMAGSLSIIMRVYVFHPSPN